MKTDTSIIVLCFMLLMPVSVAAKKVPTIHSFGGYVSAAYHTELLSSQTSLDRPHGIGAGLGFDYRLTTGALSYRSRAKGAPFFLFNTGVGLTYCYQNTYSRYGAVVPLMVGVEYRSFYFSLGAKGKVGLLDQSHLLGQVSASGELGWLITFTRQKKHANVPSPDFRLSLYADYGLMSSVQTNTPIDAGLRLTISMSYFRVPHYPCRCLDKMM